ncbi:MAG: hypothetical protein NC082_07950, partial [Clostridiales bacterium]|nr:hypothetical protein [Clostridiales bacterium]
MKKIHFPNNKLTAILLSLLITMSLASCNDDEPGHIDGDDNTPRTILVYMVGNNNLSSNAKADLAEMQLAAANGDLGESRLLVYQHMRYQTPSLVEITPQGTETLITYDTDDMSVSSKRLQAV